MGKGYTLSFHSVNSRCGGIEDKVGDVIVQEIDFVYVKYAAMSPGEYSWVEMAFAATDCFLKIYASHHSVFCSVERKSHNGDATGNHG